MNYSRTKGFTLVEVAIVFLILAALLSYAFFPLRAQLETAHIKQARTTLAEIEEALYGFAIANGRLPCPTQPGLGGLSDPPSPTSHCQNSPDIRGYIGFVPAATLGIKGETNCDGLLIDPWGRPYRYSVTNSSRSGNGDFVINGGIQSAGGPTAVRPNIKVCHDLDQACTDTGVTASTSDLVAVVFSMGNREHPNSNTENENAGEGGTVASRCGLPSYPVGNDEQYYSAPRIERAGHEFDDIVVWISPNLLYSRLLQSGHALR